MGVGERDAALGEAIEVRCLGADAGIQGADPVVEVIGGENNDELSLRRKAKGA